MIAYIVVEGSFDAQLLKCVLPRELLNNVEIVAASGKSDAKSLARSLIVGRQVPVALMIDADSVDPDLVQERLKNIQQLVEGVAVDTPVKVILAIPEMETVFFQDSLLLTRLLGYEPDQDILNWATFQPKKALEQLISQSKNHKNDGSRFQIIDQLSGEELEILRQAPLVQEVIHFLQSVRELAKVLN